MKMKFLKQYSYSNTGAITTHALEGETLEVADKYIDYFIDEKIAERVSDADAEDTPEPTDVESDDDSGSEEESDDESDSDDLTEVYKIAQTTEEALNAKGINTYVALYEFANTEDGKAWLIDQYGINKNNFNRLLDQLVTLV